MIYRSKEKIMYEILKALTTNKTKLATHIMYECRLSYAQLKQYTAFMENTNLITRVDTMFSIRKEGRDMLEILDKLFSVKLKLS